jgi:ubiquinone/menaquinone biosynthesis C-methylase UbiE
LGFYAESVEGCRQSIIDLLPSQPGSTMLDCGCSDGALTLRFADRVMPDRLLGIEIHEGLARAAADRGVEIVGRDLNGEMPLADASSDVITANQVIEHLADTDRFLAEVHRVLKPRGILVLSTNNLASWHNIAALAMGAQPFPADVSRNSSLGKLAGLFPDDPGSYESWAHLRIFSHRALKEMLVHYGFTVERIVGVGYYPLSGRVARWAAQRDPRHAAYITALCEKAET